MSSTPDPAAGPAPEAPASRRLLSLDALRGFDMFWIIGAEDIVHALDKAQGNPAADFFAGQLTHYPWEWRFFTFYDLIFPLFVFIAGASLVFSLGKVLDTSGKGAALARVLRRSALLYLLGIIYYGGISKGFEHIRLLGVLQRIAICYGAAGALFCLFRLRTLILICIGLLVGYWALMTFVPVPGAGAGSFVEGKNLANHVDKMWLPFRKWDGDHDPEGLLSTLPAIGTCLLGVFAGRLLGHRGISEQRKVWCLLGAGAAGVVLGHLWGLQFPIVKKLWTSSFVLLAGGYSCILLAIFHQIIGIWECSGWAQPFVWIGMNPLTIYLAFEFIDFRRLAERLVGGPIQESLGAYGDVLVTCVVLGFAFLIVYFLYRRRIFLRL